jgi:hypothetical protein
MCHEFITGSRAIWIRLGKPDSITEEPETILAAIEFIRANPGRPGKQIALAIGKSFEHFRKEIVPYLKQNYGLRNDANGSGYYFPKA